MLCTTDVQGLRLAIVDSIHKAALTSVCTLSLAFALQNLSIGTFAAIVASDADALLLSLQLYSCCSSMISIPVAQLTAG